MHSTAGVRDRGHALCGRRMIGAHPGSQNGAPPPHIESDCWPCMSSCTTCWLAVPAQADAQQLLRMPQLLKTTTPALHVDAIAHCDAAIAGGTPAAAARQVHVYNRAALPGVPTPQRLGGASHHPGHTVSVTGEQQLRDTRPGLGQQAAAGIGSPVFAGLRHVAGATQQPSPQCIAATAAAQVQSTDRLPARQG